ncbi:TetR/AcrR family transcriptional regulator [Micromonospora sp. DT81.3]|uniref:TetR/AcrR family transcriptional regulator n=1 Tax=Micromonospora sp. DT81.3 TaxID=3416523 RepID=UPI003CE91B94
MHRQTVLMGKSNRSDAEVTRARILSWARRLLAQGSSDQGTMKDVADAAGVTTGAIQHYWPSKSALQQEALQPTRDRTGESLPRVRWTADGYVRRTGAGGPQRGGTGQQES